MPCPRHRPTLILSVCCLAALLGPGLPAAAAAPVADTAQVDVATERRDASMPDDFTVRARVVAITPDEPTAIAWRWGGEGLGGAVHRGTLAEKLQTGQWSPPVPVRSFVEGKFPGRLFLTFTVGRHGSWPRRKQGGDDFSTGVEMEFEFSWQGRVVKRLAERGPDGGTIGLVIPAYRLAGGRTPDDAAFLDELSGLLLHARRRAEGLERLTWADRPVPRRFVILTDVGGYGMGVGYGIRHTDKQVVEAECRSLRQLGVNSLRSAPPFLLEMARRGETYAAGLGRAVDVGIMGYPVPRHRADRQSDPQSGCPFGEGVAARTEEAVREALAQMHATGVPEVWGLTVDEIGTVVDLSAEGKSHFARCERCADGFRQWLRGQGLAPADFGRKDWQDVKPVDLAPKDGPAFDAADPGDCLRAYWARRFNCYGSAHLFAPLREACARANEATRRARAEGPADSPEARRPLVYSYALRGNTFLMKGHSLDFFNFYREADNAFVYEMSNRGPQVWQWDGYLCDVGRVVSGRMDKVFGVYVKPHRGAPVQRALAAAARGARMIYWYTYGPDYTKGDSFSERPDCLVSVSKGARLLGAAEDVLYGGTWALPAEVAVVKPRTSEIWMGLSGRPEYAAAWENAKWTWTALAHAHVPVDAIDEGMLAADDLARYKVIYVNGPNVTRAAAERLAAWVRQGGTLVTSGGGLARDEANRPLEAMQAVLGLTARAEPEMYRKVALYGATSLQPFDDRRDELAPVPPGAKATCAARLGGATFSPIVGREVLRPAAKTDVLATFADGGAAATQSACGKGQAYVLGLFAGLEYSAAVRREAFDMTKDFDAGLRALVAAPALEHVRPVVDASEPLVEGVLVRHPETGRRAVVLMNWAYAAGGEAGAAARLVALKQVRVAVRGAGPVAKVVSAWLGQPLPHEAKGDGFTVTVPELAEGDVLLLE